MAMVPLMQNVEIPRILLENYEKRRSLRPTYSYHSYARLLGISSGALSSILHGQRKISKKMALRLATNLKLEGSDLQAFLGEQESAGRIADRNLNYVKIQMDQFKLISEWQHFAILSLVETKDFKNKPEWMAKRLGIPVSKVQSAVERLLQFEMLQEKGGTLRRTEARFSTSDNIVSMSLRQAHRKNLEMAGEALEKVPVELRDFIAMTSAIDMKKMPQVKELIRKFKDELSVLLDEGDRTEVYKLCVQFFPLTESGDPK